MPLSQPPDQDIVVVGASGDLSARKLLPALYNLEAEGLLPRHCAVVGFAQTDWDDAHFRAHARTAVTQFSRTGLDEQAFRRFEKRLRFIPASKGMSALRERLDRDRRIVYLAVPASAFGGLVHDIGDSGLADGTSLIIEKPFGRDYDSACALNRTLHEVLPEERIFRIDHYLGKETVQNMLVFRFGNAIFERVWNRDCIVQVEISVAESLGVEQRGRFYEETGAIRDIVQNHMFQLLSITAMEPPISFDAEALRNEKIKVLRAAHPVDPAGVVRGQYAAGTVEGKRARAYRDEPGVSHTSSTETYAAMRVDIDSWRWSGVPFYLRTGKRLKARETRIVIAFRDVPLHLFQQAGMKPKMHSNHLMVRIQPDEGIALSFIAKEPGPTVVTQSVRMDFSYGTSFKTSPPEAYERLLHDALAGDHTLFIREDEVERGWAIVQPVLDDPPEVQPYAAGSWGPAAAESVVAPGHWHSLEDAW